MDADWLAGAPDVLRVSVSATAEQPATLLLFRDLVRTEEGGCDPARKRHAERLLFVSHMRRRRKAIRELGFEILDIDDDATFKLGDPEYEVLYATSTRINAQLRAERMKQVATQNP